MTTTQEKVDLTYKMQTINLNGWFGAKQVLKDINIGFKANAVTAIIGPSGCGKSTLIRCLNRMHELVPNAKMTGRILLDGEDIYSKDVDPVMIRRRVGMVFQKPNPFPTMSIYDNVAAGLKLTGAKKGKNLTKSSNAAWRKLRFGKKLKMTSKNPEQASRAGNSSDSASPALSLCSPRLS